MFQELDTEEFDRQVGDWLDAADAPTTGDTVAWSKRLGAAGLLTPTWATEHGGSGFDRDQSRRFEKALRDRGIRRVVSGGREMLAPALLEYASPEQLLEFLPPIARSEAQWAQGYSEPQAGSDLANVQMRCEEHDADHYIVNGQKIWTSGADDSDWIFCLVRTDPHASKHDGISFLLVDLRSPGIEIKPIVLISGRSPFCEVFFTDVVVPKKNRVADEGAGWPIAKRLLQFERSMLGSGGLSSLTGSAGRKSLADVARERVGLDVEGRLRDATLRERVAGQLIDEWANRLTGARARGADATRVSSILKLASSEASQQRYSLLMDLLGTSGLTWNSDGVDPYEAGIPRQWLRSRANTIEGGTSEVQLNIIAKRVLGMEGGGRTPDQSLATDDDQRMIREAAMQLFEEEQPISELRALRDGDTAGGFSARLWAQMARLGWSGLLAPEAVGGAGLGFRELGVVMEALGRHVVAAPLLSSGVLAASALTLAEGWSEFPRAAEFASGEVTAALALEETPRFDVSALETTARRTQAGFELNGRKTSVLDAAVADCLLVLARLEGEEDEFALFLVSPEAQGVAIAPERWIDGRRAATIHFDGVRLEAPALLGTPRRADELVEPLVDRAAAALSAELVGTASQALAMTVQFLDTREQFDQKLSGFQALQHRCARLFSEIERTISLVQAALRALDEDDAERTRLASAAKAAASETARVATEEALQLYGGLGMTEEQDIGLFFKRARVSATLFGDTAYHHRRFATASGF